MKNMTHEDFVKKMHEVRPEIEILGTYIKSRERIQVRCKKCGNIWFPICNTLYRFGCQKCSLEKAHKSSRISLDKIIDEVKLLSNDTMSVSGDYINLRLPINFHCKICGVNFDKSLSGFRNNPKCPSCYHKMNKYERCRRGINDIWTTNPEIAELLLDKSDGYKYTIHNCRELKWKCKCNNIISRKIYDVMKYGLACKNCNDHFSYPNKFVHNMFMQLNIDFNSEKKFYWSDNKVYDFYIPSIECIIEVHGLQHYESVGASYKRSVDDEKANDAYKMQLAALNGIKLYIIIDARKSNRDYIMKSLLKSKLNLKFNLAKVDWDKCNEKAKSSIIYDICELWNRGEGTKSISEILKIGKASVVQCLKDGNRTNLCNYDFSKSKIGCRKPVTCINTDELFLSIKEAGLKYNTGRISACCRGKCKYAGILPNGEKLQWRYAEIN